MMNTRTSIGLRIFLLITIPLIMNSCEVLQQAQKIATLSKCDFRLQSVNQVMLAGVNVQNIHKFSDLSLMDAGRLTAAVASGQFPLDFILNVEVKNPNAADAGMTRMDWILLIDDIEMTRGALDKSYTIAGNNGISVIPMQMHVDLKKALSGKSADAIINFGLNLAGAGNKPTRVSLKVQPTISVASWPITYPGYITVGTEFGAAGK